MATMPNPVPLEELPANKDVDAADNKLGSFMSDLDVIVGAVKKMAGEVLPPEEIVKLVTAGEPLPERRIHIDPAAFARLLVFADELERDAEGLKDDAAKLRFSLLSLYRENVIDSQGSSETAV